jgi:hypothetical protein
MSASNLRLRIIHLDDPSLFHVEQSPGLSQSFEIWIQRSHDDLRLKAGHSLDQPPHSGSVEFCRWIVEQ